VLLNKEADRTVLLSPLNCRCSSLPLSQSLNTGNLIKSGECNMVLSAIE